MFLRLSLPRNLSEEFVKKFVVFLIFIARVSDLIYRLDTHPFIVQVMKG